jgi:hypothetical protein
MMNKDKKKLFEAFEKVCGVKLLKEDYDNVDEIKTIEEYLLNNLVLDLDIIPGSKEYNNIEFDFNLNNKNYYGNISLFIESYLDKDSGTEYAPPTNELIIKEVEIINLSIGDEDGDIIVYNEQNQQDNNFIEELEKKIEFK